MIGYYKATGMIALAIVVSSIYSVRLYAQTTAAATKQMQDTQRAAHKKARDTKKSTHGPAGKHSESASIPASNKQ